ncbi:hypothetical protein C8R44DRAFT_879320 [Mycena epipterygia]|nr:hypothetical protein C8R44DRAFT_879320 [Mycena epipterygia]
MSSFSETSFSLLASDPPTSTATRVIFGALLIASMVCLIHFASPMRLTRVLVAAIKDAEETYLEAIEAGVLSKFDIDTAAMLYGLQIKVSHIRVTSLHNSLSTRQAFRGFFKGRTFTILRCIHEVRELEAHIEILKEEHLRAPNPLPLGTVSLRQRHVHASGLKICKCNN